MTATAQPVRVDALEATILVVEIDDLAAELARCYNHLPAAPRASVLKLGHSLSNLRRKLVPEELAERCLAPSPNISPTDNTPTPLLL